MGIHLHDLSMTKQYTTTLINPNSSDMVIVGKNMEVPAFNVVANFDNLNRQFLQNTLLQGVASQVGASTQIDFFTNQTWTGTELIELNLRLGLIDIEYPGLSLRSAAGVYTWPMPKHTNIIEGPPFKTATGPFISARIARWFEASDVFICTAVSINPSPTVERNTGNPIRIEVQITLRTSRVYSGPEVRSWFKI